MAEKVRYSDDVMVVNELTPFVRETIKNIIKNAGFASYTVKVNDISTNGGNYMAALQAVTIKGKSKDGEELKLNLFLKNILPFEGESILDVGQVYLREGFVYNDLFKIIEKIENKYQVPQEDRLNIAKPYGGINDQVIILEDVSKLGFKTYNRNDVVPLKFAELSMEQLGKFHAMSFVIQKEYPNYFEEKIKSLHSLFIINDDLRQYARNYCNKAMETLDEDAKIRIDNFYPKIIGKIKKYFHVSANTGIGLVHGDFRPNNIMVKEVDGEVKKVIPVDYQITQFGYPVIDLVYFIFVSTDRKFRTDHLTNLKDLYYRTFENFLGTFGIDAKDVYPRKQFEQEYADKLDFGLMSFLAVMPFLFPKEDAIPNLEHGFHNTSFDMDESYKDRLHEIVHDFIEWGYL